MVAINPVGATALTLLKASPTAAADPQPGGASPIPHVNAASTRSFGPGVAGALARIGELAKQLDAIKSGSASDAAANASANDAIALVKSWVKAGTFKDAASGRDDALLRQMARDHQLPTLPALTTEQERSLSLAELRVYVEAKWWQANYEVQPATLEDAKSQFVQMTLSGLPDAIAAQRAAIASGAYNDEQMSNVTADLASMEAQLGAVRSGNVKIELMDPSFYTMSTNTFRTVRDGSGLIIGAAIDNGAIGGPSLTDQGYDHYGVSRGSWFYKGQGQFGHSEYLGAYVITWGET
ncbi:hypothetical protein [Bradyrhizobium sp. 23AC]